MSQAAHAVEKAIGHQGDAITAQDVSNYTETGDASQTMKALVWQGKNTVKVVDTPRPKILEDRDVILRVTGSTICGSDLHLFHGSILQMAKGDIMGHEFCGVVDEMGPGVKGIKKGGRYVASFQIACGDVSYPRCFGSPFYHFLFFSFFSNIPPITLLFSHVRVLEKEAYLKSPLTSRRPTVFLLPQETLVAM